MLQNFLVRNLRIILKGRVFVLCSQIMPDLTQVKCFSGAPLFGKLQDLSTNIRLSWKGLLETNTSLLWQLVKYGR
jgi:hypothetical protein